MSKVSFSRELLGTIKFSFDKTKSRNLNATQAYDSSTSQIVLASYPATSTINTPTNSLGSAYPYNFGVDVNVTGTQFPDGVYLFPREKAGLAASAGQAPKTITLDLRGNVLPATVAAAKQTTFAQFANVDTAQFCGTIVRADATGPNAVDRKSNATKEIFAGNITVGTGLYRTWQGKYAVLKVDLLTDKAILRVYNE